MRKFIGLLAILALFSGCLIIHENYQYNQERNKYRLRLAPIVNVSYFGNIGFWNPYWHYWYYTNWYNRYYSRYGYGNYYRGYIVRSSTDVISKRQLTKRQSKVKSPTRTIIRKNQISKSSSNTKSTQGKTTTSKKIKKK